MSAQDVVCWEVLDPTDPGLELARQLYETALPASERIPWEWIESSTASRRAWKPGTRSRHLILAANREIPQPIGFVNGLHIPGFAGYISYLGVDAQQRQRGIGARLLEIMLHLFQVDALCAGEPLPFVLFDSRRPAANDPPQVQNIWQARMRLFDRAGARWLSGIELYTPNFSERGDPIPLQLFLIPVDTSESAFTPEKLGQVACDLLQLVYRKSPDDVLYQKTLGSVQHPELRSPVEAM